ncbi:hypothetical protein EFR84_25205 [Rhizobium chutanense]|uniref:Uncharacterized protein n=1 Tax=Rhizobium chutanense TaxID=2035448 RepID=A0A3S0QA09_9HYPH|nr:hypothetical protein EFR84_25205 [Rhizobium chutanense]
MTLLQRAESPAPKDLGALDSCDEHRNEEAGRRLAYIFRISLVSPTLMPNRYARCRILHA